MADAVAFLGVSALVIVTPGQDTALTIRNVLLGGRIGGICTTIGVCAGQATWAVATAAGIGAILVASPPAFAVLRLAGSAYLVFLGARGLLDALRSPRPADLAASEHELARLSPETALRQGLLSNLANPKMLAFFTSLLPQFASSPVELLAYGLVFCCLTLVWLTGYTVLAARAETLLRGERVRRAFEALTGIVLITLGAQIVLVRP